MQITSHASRVTSHASRITNHAKEAEKIKAEADERERARSKTQSRLRRAIICGVGLLLGFIVLFAIILTGLHFYIPVYVNDELIPLLPEKTGIEGLFCEIRRIGLTGADVASLRVGHGSETAILVRSVQMDYSPQGLYNKHIKRIRLSGIEFYCGIENGKFIIRGFDLKKFLDRRPSDPSPNTAPPISLGCLDIRNAAIICDGEGKTFRLPFEIELLPEKGWDILKVLVHLHPRGQEMRLSGNVNLRQKQILLNFDAKAVHLERFADFTKGETILSGKADVTGEVLLKTDPFEISSLSAVCELRNCRIIHKQVTLKAENRPCRVEMTGDYRSFENTGGLNLSMSSISLLSPMPLRLSDMRCDLKMARGIAEGSGDFTLALEKSLSPPVQINEPFETNGNFFATLRENGEWAFGMTLLDKRIFPPKSCEFSVNDLDIRSEIPKIDISANGKPGGGAAEYTIIFSEVKAGTASLAVNIPMVSLRGTTRFGADVQQTEGVVTVSEAGLSVSGLKMSDITGRIPLKWPCNDSASEGKVSVGSIRWGNLDIGTLSGTIRQKETGFVFTAAHENRLIPGLIANLTGKSGREGTDIHLISHHKIDPDIDIGQFLPDAKGVTVNGDLTLQSHLNLSDKGVRGSLDSSLNRANLFFKEKDIAVEGVDLTFSLPALPEIRSAARHGFDFKKASFGDLGVTDGKIAFQLEPDGSLFIEKSSFKWCNGNVSFQALRFSPGVEDYDVVLHCDRLNLAMLLEQMGAAGNAEGEGTVNGRIPIRIENGKLRFDDAFLFSTPGEGGRIHVTGTEILTAGIPPNTLHYAQVDLAREVLKEFDYQWARVNLKTEGENLKVGIQFDGKPANPLPFVYKKEFGGFAKVEVGNPGSRFQGIRLDVNLTLPLDEILKYKDLFGRISGQEVSGKGVAGSRP